MEPAEGNLKADASSRAKKDKWKFAKDRAEAQKEAQEEGRQFIFDFAREGEYNPIDVPPPPEPVPEPVPPPPAPYEPVRPGMEYSDAFIRAIETRQQRTPRTQAVQKKGALTAANRIAARRQMIRERESQMDRLRSGQDVAPAAPDVNAWYADAVEAHLIPIDRPPVPRRGEKKFIPQWHRVREGHYEKAAQSSTDLPPGAVSGPQVVDIVSQKMKAEKPPYEKPAAKKKAKPRLKFEEIRAAIQRSRDRAALAEKENLKQIRAKTT